MITNDIAGSAPRQTHPYRLAQRDTLPSIQMDIYFQEGRSTFKHLLQPLVRLSTDSTGTFACSVRTTLPWDSYPLIESPKHPTLDYLPSLSCLK